MFRILPVVLVCVAWISFVPEVRAAEDLSGVRLAVVPDARTLPKKARGAIDRQVSGPLGRMLDVIPARRTLHAAKSKGGGMPNTPDAAAALGAGLDATQVLLLSSSQGGRRGRGKLIATLVDVSTGEMREIGRFEMKRGRLSARAGKRLIEEVTRQLGSSESGAEPHGSASAIADAGDSPNGAPTDDSATQGGNSPWDGVDSDGGAPGWAASATSNEGQTESISENVEVASRSRGSDAGVFRLRAGGIAFQRSGKVTGDGVATPPEFQTDGWLPGATVRLELFPFAGSESKASGLGLYTDGYVARVVNLVAGEAGYNNATIVYSAHGGMLYRVPLWGSAAAPVLGAGLGYSIYTFPVESDLFPALGYTGPRGCLELTVPMGSRFAIGLAGAYSMPMGLQADAASLGTFDMGASRAYSGEASVRARFSAFELSVFAGMEHYELSFEGQATAASVAGTNNAAVTDGVLRSGLTLGLVL